MGVSQNYPEPQQIPIYEAEELEIIEGPQGIVEEPASLMLMEKGFYDNLAPENMWKETALTEEYLQSVGVEVDEYGAHRITLKFNSEGGEIFADLTEKNIGSPLGIFINGELISAPIVNERITGGEAIITGNFTTAEAHALAASLNAAIE